MVTLLLLNEGVEVYESGDVIIISNSKPKCQGWQ